MAKVGQLTIENDWLKKNLLKFSGSTGRISLVSKDDELPVKRQCELIGERLSTLSRLLKEMGY